MTASTHDRVLVLVVPGLFGDAAIERGAVPRLPALETLCARSERIGGLPSGFNARLLFFFGLPVDRTHPPIAPLTRIADSGTLDAGAWLRADPVFLQADGARVVLAATDRLALTRAEAEALQGELRALLAPEGLTLECLHPQRWYLKLRQLPDIRTQSPAAALGRDIHDYLPGGPEGKHWRRLFNEIQMVLHASPINEQREARGELPINSLWFWGEGELPASPARAPYAQVWTDEPLGAGLARLARQPTAAPVLDLDAWLQAAITSGEHLVVLEDAARPLEYGDVESWSQAVARLETAWFAPLIIALRARDISAVKLYTDHGPGFALNVRQLRRWWRRRRPLIEY